MALVPIQNWELQKGLGCSVQEKRGSQVGIQLIVKRGKINRPKIFFFLGSLADKFLIGNIRNVIKEKNECVSYESFKIIK